MKYFLRNISQSTIPRTVLSIVLGMGFWIYSFIQTDALLPTIITCGLTICNAILLALVFSRLDITNLPSFFVATTYWLVVSSMPMLHTYWQGQVLVASIWIALLILGGVGRHHQDAVEESFLSTLIISVVSMLIWQTAVGIVVIWLYLLGRRALSWRSWLASIIAVLVVVLYGGICFYFGWIQFPWNAGVVDNGWYAWTEIAVMLLVSVITYFPLRAKTIATGVLYLTSVVAVTVSGIWILITN